MRPVTAVNMNYAPVVTVGLIAFVLGLWFLVKRGSFKGPRVDMKELVRRRELALIGRSLNVHGGNPDMMVEEKMA